MKTYPIYRVQWDDIQSSGGWYDKDALDEAGVAHCESVGYLVYRDRKVIKLASIVEYEKTRDAGYIHAIPRGCVTKMWRIDK
ncbi:MAG: hypothetical protein IID31_14160 [Planctomycetes bacterium]|nr:hypothetical protein [Planctomycetota bacterium]